MFICALNESDMNICAVSEI